MTALLPFNSFSLTVNAGLIAVTGAGPLSLSRAGLQATQPKRFLFALLFPLIINSSGMTMT